MRKTIIIILVSILLVIGGVALIKKKKSNLARLKTAKQYPIIIKTIKPEISNFKLTITGLGIVKSGLDVKIATKLTARILSMKQLGCKVNKGEIIAKLDSSSVLSKLVSTKSHLGSLKSKLRSAKLTLDNMIQTHQRTKELLNVKGASIEQYQKEENLLSDMKSNISAINADIKSTRSTMNELKMLLSYSLIKSPINGIISKKFFNSGDIATPGKPIYEISSRGEKYILIRLPQNINPKGIIFHNKFYQTEALNGTFNGLNEYKADVNTTINTNSRIEISVVVFNAKAIKIPIDAILNDNNKNYVFITSGNRAVPRKINIIASGEEGLAINDKTLIGKELVVAKPDILLKLLGGTLIKKEQ